MTHYIQIILSAYNALFFKLWILNILQDGSLMKYLVKASVNEERADVFSYNCDFPIDIMYMWKVLPKTSFDRKGRKPVYCLNKEM